MTLAVTLQRYLADHGIDYDVVTHRPTMSSSQTAEASHVPGDFLAKAVIVKDEDHFKDPVRSAMTSKLQTIDADRPLPTLLPILDQGLVAIVVENGQFLGLITRIDLLNYLRRRMK